MYRFTVDSLRDLLIAARNDADTPIETLIREAQLMEAPDEEVPISTPPLSDDESSSELSEDVVLWDNPIRQGHNQLALDVELADFKAQLAIQGSEIGFLYELIDLDIGYSNTFTVMERVNGKFFSFWDEEFSASEWETLEEYLFYGRPMKKARPPCGQAATKPTRKDFEPDPDISPGLLRDRLRFTYLLRHAKDGITPPGLVGIDPSRIDFDREGYYSVYLPGDGKAYLYFKDRILISVNARDLPPLVPKKRKLGVRPSRLRRYEAWRNRHAD